MACVSVKTNLSLDAQHRMERQIPPVYANLSSTKAVLSVFTNSHPVVLAFCDEVVSGLGEAKSRKHCTVS